MYTNIEYCNIPPCNHYPKAWEEKVEDRMRDEKVEPDGTDNYL